MRTQYRRHDVLVIPIVWVAFLLSLLMHVGALWFTLPNLLGRAADAKFGEGRTQLAVELRPPPAPPTPPVPSAPPTPPPASPATPPLASSEPPPVPKRVPPIPKRVVPKPESERSAPRVAVAPKAPQQVIPPAPPTIPEATPRPPDTPSVLPPSVAAVPRETDLTAYIAARRRERGESAPMASAGEMVIAPPAENEAERRNRIVASNLGLNRTPSFGYDPEKAGGMFQITSLEYDYADFWFLGLNKAIGRNAKQRIEVRKGNDSDIRVSVVRRMIQIIREHVSDEFVWISRQGPVTMSARPSENAELEAFIMRDIFPEARISQSGR